MRTEVTIFIQSVHPKCFNQYLIGVINNKNQADNGFRVPEHAPSFAYNLVVYQADAEQYNDKSIEYPEPGAEKVNAGNNEILS